MGYSAGKYAYGICDKTGFRYPIKELVFEMRNGVRTGLKVGYDVVDPDHPQNFLGKFKVDDSQSLLDARPDRTEPEAERLLNPNPYTHSGSGVINVKETNHGRTTGDTVRFRNSLGVGSLITQSAMQLANGYSITVLTDDTYKFTIPDISTATESVNYTVTVVGGNPSNHPSYNVGSSNKYAINGSTATADVQLTFKVGSTYRFTLSSSDMSSHPLRLYLDADKTTQYTTGVTSTSTYTEITVASGAPSTLFYQCSIHGNMGARITVTEVDAGLNTDFGGSIASAGPVTLES
jgi:plastocyanin